MMVKKRAIHHIHKRGLNLLHRTQAPKAPVEEDTRGLNANVRFFVDHVVSVAVNSVARQQSQRTRLHMVSSNGLALNVVVSCSNDSDGMRFVAYSNESCLSFDSSPSLFVISQNPRELEHSIYLYLSERLTGHVSVCAELRRDASGSEELPVLVGSSEDGPRSLYVKPAAIGR